MKHIVLIGMMGCGKSTIGGMLSQVLGRKLVDTDHLIEEEQGTDIPTLFAQKGEPYFRQQEAIVAQRLAQQEGLIISCGGGLPTVEQAIAPLYNSGMVFFLERNPKDIISSVSMEGRPLGQDGEEAFLARYQQREPIYRQWSHHVIPGDGTPDQVLQRILEVLS